VFMFVTNVCVLLQSRLLSDYFFTCECTGCMDKRNTELDIELTALKCLTCNTGLVSELNRMQCNSCGKVLSDYAQVCLSTTLTLK
jgi:hypothetical protein